ncbi:MAG TPA: SxtJ family membrane protein [Vicinamibacterales bacterium]|nr:SxtJ family membrane protein [Vicinamibacterales bacterium]
MKHKKQKPFFQERSFGVSVGGVLILVAAYLAWRSRLDRAAIVGTIGAVLVILGLTAPALLKWPSAVWWKFAMVLGHVNARVILTIVFAVVLTPVGLAWRLLGKDPLARRRRQWHGWSPSPARFKNPDHFTRMY